MSIPDRKCNDAGVALIMGFEKCRLKAYKPVPTDPWTIGYGDTENVSEGMIITQAEADRRFLRRLDQFCKAVCAMVNVELTDNQFAALVCLCYNIGIGALKNSTLMKKLNYCDYHGAAAQFDLWNKSAGKVLEGLCNRREAERQLFET